MKKILIGLLFVSLALAGIKAHALNDDNGGTFRRGGGKLTNSSTITFGTFPLATSCLSGVFLSDVSITAGDVVIAPTTALYNSGYNEVSRTTSTGSQNVIGVALETVPPGVEVRVAYGAGTVVVHSAADGAVGQLYCTGGTAGCVTRTSSLTGATFTQLSRTPSVIMCIQNKTISAVGDTISGILIR